MAGKKVSKNQVKSTGGVKDEQIKYSDPRMAYSSTKKEMVIKESEYLKMLDVFGGDIPGATAQVVVCEDQNGFYLTSKNFVGAPILDPYRNYRREMYTIVKNEDETFKVVTNNSVEYTI